jgi:prepilin-type N-terminal cleavage/methylation domain-containing protein
MRRASLVRIARPKGFTLVESLIVLVVLSIAAAAIISLQANIFLGQSGSNTIEVGAQLMQECADYILGTRRNDQTGYGYSAVSTSSCSSSTRFGNYGGISGTPTVAVTATGGTAGSTTSCVSTSSTCLVNISIAGLNSIYLQLVNY